MVRSYYKIKEFQMNGLWILNFWACLFCEGQKSRALAAQSFCFEKKQKGFQTNRSITHAET